MSQLQTLSPQTLLALKEAQVVTVVGTRPQFVKASEISRAFEAAGVREFLVHTGQHYDDDMSRVFFEQLQLRSPDLNLDIGSGPHGQQTGRMLEAIEALLVAAAPARPRVLVYGDCNSTLAAALAAAKLALPLDHIEAGLRSFKKHMPEEINRVLTDRLSDLLFCPTPTAVEHLRGEGLTQGVHMVGDVMCDAVERQLALSMATNPTALHLQGKAVDEALVRADLKLPQDAPLPRAGRFRVATIHRASNTDDPDTLGRLLECLADAQYPTYLLLHPRTRARMEAHGLKADGQNLITTPPASYHTTLAMVHHAHQLLTDSGGLQKEAMMLSTPCITLRHETEWVETVASGWNTLTGSNPAKIKHAMNAAAPEGPPPRLYGDGQAAVEIVRWIKGAMAPEVA